MSITQVIRGFRLIGDDFRDFIQAMNNYEVEYVLVVGYAVILHGYRRVTGDMDSRTSQRFR